MQPAFCTTLNTCIIVGFLLKASVEFPGHDRPSTKANATSQRSSEYITFRCLSSFSLSKLKVPDHGCANKSLANRNGSLKNLSLAFQVLLFLPKHSPWQRALWSSLSFCHSLHRPSVTLTGAFKLSKQRSSGSLNLQYTLVACSSVGR